MGAVMLLVLLPISAALGFMIMSVVGDPGEGGMLAAFMFLFLSCVIAVGALRMAREWDDGESDH